VMRMTAGNTEVRNAADTGEGAQGRSGIGAPASRCSPRTTPLRRSITAISTGAVRGQVPEREARWAEQELLAGFPAGRTSTIATPPEVLVSRSGDLTP
jgi:hypothetical protein